MASTNILYLYARAWRLLLLVTLGGMIIALLGSAIQPLKFSSTIRLLITQTNATGVDPYTAIKSTERIGQNLTEIIYTSSFFNAVMQQSGIDSTYFPQDEIDKRQEWKDTVETNVVAGTGIMEVTVYHKDRNQATAIAVAVAKELAAQAPNYFGYSVRLQIIDDPLPSRFFAKPDFIRNGALGALFGFLVGSLWVLVKMKEIR
ncbi:MAG: YveK family protein [Patescibacteria group bacterium]